MLYQSAGIEHTYNNRITSRAGYSWAREYQRENTRHEYRENNIPGDYEQYRQASIEARARAYQSGFTNRNSKNSRSFSISRESFSNILKLFVIIISAALIISAGLFLFSSAKGDGFRTFNILSTEETTEYNDELTDVPVEELSLNAAI